MINAQFDSGNIETISQKENVYECRIRPDTQAQFKQWFYFSVSTQAGASIKIKIINASECSYPEGWENYSALMSYDRKHWRRVSTRYDGQSLMIEHTSEHALVFYAYFAPYTYEDYLNWIAEIQKKCVVHPLTKTTEGRMLHYLQLGQEGKNKKRCWFVARQHSGESMASWFIEGLVSRLLDEKNPVTQSLLKDAVFYIVPLMNPDGVYHGNLRANGNGLDLNRQWHDPSEALCP